MLQVPCLSPPIYGHSHYKKFWLRQTELGGVSCEMKSTSSPDASSSKRICGKRRPQVRSSLAKTDVERLKVPLNESPAAVSSTSSGEFPSGWKRSFRKFQRGSDGDATNSTLSSVENRDGVETPVRSGSPADDKSFISMSEDKSSLQFLQINECQASLLATQEENEACKQLVRQNMSATDSDDEPNVSHSSEQTAAASLDCLTSKCKGIDSRQEDNGSEQDSDNDNSSSDSDSAISSTSQASDHDDARSHSDKSSFREHLKRQSKREAIKAKPASYGSPKTRQMAASLENPVSPSGRSTQVMGSSSANNAHNVSRTCKHCGTMKTPLWRNGPLGPKSLCNACGIRLRKARRSSNHEGQTANLSGKRKLVQAEATIISDLSRHPYKKSRLTFAREKRDEIEGIRGSRSSLPERLASGYDSKPGILGKSLSKDEEEGAVLLMALSCGLVLA